MLRIAVNLLCVFIRMRRTPRPNRTETLCPSTTLFRPEHHGVAPQRLACRERDPPGGSIALEPYRAGGDHGQAAGLGVAGDRAGQRSHAASRRSDEHTSELQSLMRISYDVFCLTKKKTNTR